MKTTPFWMVFIIHTYGILRTADGADFQRLRGHQRPAFVTTGFSGQYDGIRVRILNRTEGEVDARLFYFRDIFNNTPAAKTAYICDNYGDTKWYNYQPNARDFEHLTEKLGGYIAMYQDEGMEMSPPSM